MPRAASQAATASEPELGDIARGVPIGCTDGFAGSTTTFAAFRSAGTTLGGFLSRSLTTCSS